MKKHISRCGFLITTLFVMIGVMGIQPASADTSITIESVSYSNDSASANVTKEERALISGATQVTWENPNHNLKVTAAQIKRAPKIKTGCSSSNRYTQSKQIWNKTHRGIVIVKPGSCLWNRGRLGNILAGFKYYPKVPIVLMMDAKHRYRHSHTLKTKSQLAAGDTVVGKVYVMGAWRYIVKSCLNYIGGPVNTTVIQVVQIRYESDVQLDIAIEANASVKAKVEASLQCDSGKLYGYAEASASASASTSIRVKSGVKVSAVNAKKIELLNQVTASAKAKAEAQAKAKITLTCSDTPPPPSYSAPSVSANASACVEPGQATGIVTVTATNNNDVAAFATFAFPGKTSQAATIAAHATVSKQFTGVASGSYSGSVAFGSPINKSAPFSVTVQECDVPPPPIDVCPKLPGDQPEGTDCDRAPVVNIMGSPAHLYVGGNAYVWIEASDPDGDAVSVQVSASGAGTVAGLVPSDVRWDGTPCPSGKSCYRATAWAGDAPGTLTITAKVTANGKSATDSVSFPVKADEF